MDVSKKINELLSIVMFLYPLEIMSIDILLFLNSSCSYSLTTLLHSTPGIRLVMFDVSDQDRWSFISSHLDIQLYPSPQNTTYAGHTSSNFKSDILSATDGQTVEDSSGFPPPLSGQCIIFANKNAGIVTCCDNSAIIFLPDGVTKPRRCMYAPTKAIVEAVPTARRDARNVGAIEFTIVGSMCCC